MISKPRSESRRRARKGRFGDEEDVFWEIKGPMIYSESESSEQIGTETHDAEGPTRDDDDVFWELKGPL